MPAPDRLLQSLPTALRESVRTAVPLCDLTTLRVGGPAALVCPVHTPEDALRFQGAAGDAEWPVFVLGAGSNVLADDAGYGGLVLLVNGNQCRFHGDAITAAAGIDFDELIAATLRAGLTGLEFASGIPGTLGGALVGNAGCYGHEIGEFVREALLLTPDGRLEHVGPEAFGFDYRESCLRETGTVVLEATLQLARGDAAAAGDVRAERIADRRRKHPIDVPCAGSWFRNLPPANPGGRRQAAGRLLEQVGAKSMREGDAGVFDRHANIIVNRGRASSGDVRRLVGRMQAAVRDRFGVELIEEVRYLAPDASTPRPADTPGVT